MIMKVLKPENQEYVSLKYSTRDEWRKQLDWLEINIGSLNEDWDYQVSESLAPGIWNIFTKDPAWLPIIKLRLG